MTTVSLNHTPISFGAAVRDQSGTGCPAALSTRSLESPSDSHSTTHTTPVPSMFKTADHEADAGTETLTRSSPTTSAEKPGVSSSNTFEIASSSSTTDEPEPAGPIENNAQGAKTLSLRAAATSKMSQGKGPFSPSAMQHVAQLLERHLSVNAIRECAQAASTDTADGAGVTDQLLNAVDSRVTVPLLTLLGVEPLMSAVLAGLNEVMPPSQASGASAGNHNTLQCIQFLLESLRFSRHLLLRDDLPVPETEPVVLLPVDACELRQLRVGPASHASPDARCTLLLECAAEDTVAVRTLEDLRTSRLSTVLKGATAAAVVVTCAESPDCLAVAFTDGPAARDGFVQLQECAPYKAGLLTVRMRVENGHHAAARGTGRSHGFLDQVETAGGVTRRLGRSPSKNNSSLARALAVVRAATTESRTSPRAASLTASLAAPQAASSSSGPSSTSAPTSTTERVPCTVSGSNPTCAPVPIDEGDMSGASPTKPSETAHGPAVATSAPELAHHSGLNLAAVPFVPRALRGLGGSMEDMDGFRTAATGHPVAVRDAAGVTGGLPYGTLRAPPVPVCPLDGDESERLAAQMLLDSQRGLFPDPFGGVPPQPVVPWEDTYSRGSARPTSHASAPYRRDSAAPVAKVVPIAPIDGDNGRLPTPEPRWTATVGDSPSLAARTQRHQGSPLHRMRPPPQPRAVGDEPSPSSDSLTPPRPCGAAMSYGVVGVPQPPTPLTGDEPCSLTDSQTALSASRRWRRHNPYNMAASTVETSAPSSPSQSLTGEQSQRTPLHLTSLLKPGARASPTFIDPVQRARERSRMSATISSTTTSADCVAEMAAASAVAH